MSGFEVAHLGELETVPIEDGLLWHPVRRHFGLTAFGINAYTAEAVGGHVVERHTEKLGQEEVYVVVRGRARFTVGGEERDAPAGTIVAIRDATLEREAVAEDPDTLVLAVGGMPGAHEISSWEWIFLAMPAMRAGRWDEAIRLHEEGLAEKPGDPRLLYNLACCEARAGFGDDAVAHLGDAVMKDDSLRTMASKDEDFATIREHPGFPA